MSRRFLLCHLLLMLLLLHPVGGVARSEEVQAPATSPATKPAVMDEETKKVVDAATRYIAAQQREDGSWQGFDGGENKPDQHRVGVTSLAILALISSGNLPNEGPYAQSAEKGVSF